MVVLSRLLQFPILILIGISESPDLEEMRHIILTLSSTERLSDLLVYLGFPSWEKTGLLYTSRSPGDGRRLKSGKGMKEIYEHVTLLRQND
jgi:hypothetical protein